MAISLKRYEPQVGVSAETGLQPISGSTASSMIKAAGAEDQLISNIGQKVLKTTENIFEERNKRKIQIEKQQRELDEKVRKLQSGVIKTSIENNLDLALTAYKESSDLETDATILGTDNDTAYTTLKNQGAELLSSIDQNQFPFLYAEMQSNINSAIQKAGTIAKFDGIEKTLSVGQAQTEERFNNLLDLGDIDGAKGWLEGRVDYYTSAADQKKYEELLLSIPGKLEMNKVVTESQVNLNNTIKKVQNQIDGKEVDDPYNLSREELISVNSEFLQIRTQRQNEAYDNLYDVNSPYLTLTISGKKEQLIKLREDRTISADHFKAEMKQLENPEANQVTAESLRLENGYNQTIINNIDDAGTLGSIAEEVLSNENLPSIVKGRILSKIRDYQKPDSRLKNFGASQAEYTLKNTLEYLIENGDSILNEDDFKGRNFFGTTWFKEADQLKFESAKRHIVLEATDELNKWFLSLDARPTPKEITDKIDEIVNGKVSNYNINTAVNPNLEESSPGLADLAVGFSGAETETNTIPEVDFSNSEIETNKPPVINFEDLDNAAD
tara:strand:- start:5568 stop:7235 length:1668 start_codon:yes stop_codon:yes gene_type:complete